jgi:hypothetical protein
LQHHHRGIRRSFAGGLRVQRIAGSQEIERAMILPELTPAEEAEIDIAFAARLKEIDYPNDPGTKYLAARGLYPGAYVIRIALATRARMNKARLSMASFGPPR